MVSMGRLEDSRNSPNSLSVIEDLTLEGFSSSIMIDSVSFVSSLDFSLSFTGTIVALALRQRGAITIGKGRKINKEAIRKLTGGFRETPS